MGRNGDAIDPATSGLDVKLVRLEQACGLDLSNFSDHAPLPKEWDAKKRRSAGLLVWMPGRSVGR